MMNKKVSPWIEEDYCAYRVILGRDPTNIGNRVAFIEKTPRVRIRNARHRVILEWDEDKSASVPVGEHWPEWLDWCTADFKGDGPNDEESRAWCDKMLIALGYQL